MRFFATTLWLCGVVASVDCLAAVRQTQTPVVPHKMHFAGMTLAINDDAREEIQKDVEALTRSPKYFNVKVERARTYFPIIERIFAEERVPDDFKFLVLQESALIADAVSVSNAVGFWQFKDFTAREMGLRVDNDVDERMNIVSATRGAARYIKQNNFMFNNWVYALQAYQMGAGGVRRSVGDEVNGSRHMDITKDTYWYVKKYLAHKVAFEDAVKGTAQLKIAEHVLQQGGSLQNLSAAISTDIEGLKEFNKWVRNDAIPADKQYTLIVPTGDVAPDFSKLLVPPATTETVAASQPIDEKPILINDIPVLQAKPGETLDALASRAGVSLSHFLKYNDLDEKHKVNAGGYYFMEKKKSKTEQDFHKVVAGETLWQVSQKYGVQVKRLKKYNHLNDDDAILPGTMLWLSATKPRDGETLEDEGPVAELASDKAFEWMEADVAATVRMDAIVAAPGEHVVQAGETLYAIARKYDLTVVQLKELNGFGDGNELKPGQVIKVSANEQVTSTAKETFHEIKEADTLYSVARLYGVTIKDLMELNNKKDFSVTPGEKLKIPSH